MEEKNRQDNGGEKDVGLYEKLFARTKEIVDSGRKNLDEALKKAGEELSQAGEYTREQAEKIGEYVRRDMFGMEKGAARAAEAIKNAVDPQRASAGVKSVVARCLRGIADGVGRLAEMAERQVEYKTGEVTSAGTLTCLACGADMSLKGTGRIPPCPKCYKTRFRKSY